MCVFKRFVNFHILHDRLNSNELLFKVKFFERDKCLYSQNILESPFHAIIGCLYTAKLWKQKELWLRRNIIRNIKIVVNDKILWVNIDKPSNT